MKGMFISAIAAVSVNAVASVTPGTVAVDGDSGRVTVEYSLSRPAIVTFDVQTNAGTSWVSIGLDRVTRVAGDVNRLVTSAAGRIVWMPRQEEKPVDIAVGKARVVLREWSEKSPPNYLAINLSVHALSTENASDIPEASKISYYEAVSQLPGGIRSDAYRSDIMLFRKIPARNVSWKMGTSGLRTVVLTNDYYMSVFEATQAQMSSLTGWKDIWKLSSYTNCALRPADKVRMLCYNDNDRGLRYPLYWPTNDYVEAHKVNSSCYVGRFRSYIGWGLRLDLPTEAQWEYAARAGEGGELPDGSQISVKNGAEDANVSRFARYRYNGGYAENGTVKPAVGCGSECATAVVGSYEPNAWGLYDVLGNVQEWCLDSYAGLSSGCVTNPAGYAARQNNHVLRGGSYASDPGNCMLSSRVGYNYWIESPSDNIGFRLCLTLPPPDPAPEGALIIDELAEVKSSADPTNGGYWDVSGYEGAAVAEAYAALTDALKPSTASVSSFASEAGLVSMFQTEAFSAPGALKSTPLSLYLIVR